jgi:hypothetical protein
MPGLAGRASPRGPHAWTGPCIAAVPRQPSISPARRRPRGGQVPWTAVPVQGCPAAGSCGRRPGRGGPGRRKPESAAPQRERRAWRRPAAGGPLRAPSAARSAPSPAQAPRRTPGDQPAAARRAPIARPGGGDAARHGARHGGRGGPAGARCGAPRPAAVPQVTASRCTRVMIARVITSAVPRPVTTPMPAAARALGPGGNRVPAHGRWAAGAGSARRG